MAEERRVTIPYAPRKAFGGYHDRSQRFAVGVAHRRCGKTVACINDLIKNALQNTRAYPPGRSAYIGPQLNQSKDNVWQYLKYYAAPVMQDKNEADLWVELVNGARIRLYGADNPDRIRGAYLDDVVLDEYADMHPGVWGEIVRPMLADYRGRATFIGTPKGRNPFFDLYEQAKADEDWFTFMLPASVTKILPEEELRSAAKDMTPEQYDQEFECSFEAAIMGAYFGREMAQAERDGRIRDDLDIIEGVPIQTAWDIGNSDHMAIWCFQVGAGEIRVHNFIQKHGFGIDDYCNELTRLGYAGTDWVPHDARVKSLETKRTRIETLTINKRRPRLVPDHKVMDGINAARVTFPRIYFNGDACRTGLEALRQYRAEYDDKARVFKDAPKKDWATHPADAFRYMCMAWREIVQQPDKPQDRILSVGSTNTATLNDLWGLQPKRSKRI